MEKLVRAVMVGFVLSVAALISLGWKAYAEMNDMGKTIKKEIKAEMMEVRQRDMEWIQTRFNSLELMQVGRVVSPQKNFQDDTEK